MAIFKVHIIQYSFYLDKMEWSLYSFLEDNFVLVAVFIVLLCIVYGYRTLFSNGTHRDLLSARHVRLPPRTLVTDPKARNAVLKQSKSKSNAYLHPWSQIAIRLHDCVVTRSKLDVFLILARILLRRH